MTATSSNTNFCLSGTEMLSPEETAMASCSDKYTDISASQTSAGYVNQSYEQLKNGSHNVKTSDETFACPYCPNKKRKRDYVLREILEHAYGVGRSDSPNRSAIEKANHLALVKYLKNDLMNGGGPSKPMNEGDPR